MITCGMFEAKTHFSQLVDDLVTGKTDCVQVSRRGNPVVQITVVQKPPAWPKHKLGIAKGLYRVPPAFDAHFDDPDPELERLFAGSPEETW